MEFKATKHIGLMAVVIDEEMETSETIRVDTLRCLLFGINYCPGAKVGTDTGIMQLAFAWGGYDSRGQFHTDVQRKAAHRSISSDVDGEREFWKEVAFDEKGNPLASGFDAAFFHKVLFEVPLAGKTLINHIVDGGWRFEELELKCNDRCVYSKKKK